MTQGLQISMLLSTDTSLKAGAGKADVASDSTGSEPGSAFGAMFGELMQPAKSGLADASLRQLPADVSLLSGITQALKAGGINVSSEEKLALGSTDVLTDESDDAEDSLLAANLLKQMAFKDKAAGTSEQAMTDIKAADSEDGTALEEENSPVASDTTAAQSEADKLQVQEDKASIDAKVVGENNKDDTTTAVKADGVDNDQSGNPKAISNAAGTQVNETGTRASKTTVPEQVSTNEELADNQAQAVKTENKAAITEQKPEQLEDVVKVAPVQKTNKLESLVPAGAEKNITSDQATVSNQPLTSASQSVDTELSTQIKPESTEPAAKGSEKVKVTVSAQTDEKLTADNASLDGQDSASVAENTLLTTSGNKASPDTEQKAAKTSSEKIVFKSEDIKADSSLAAKQGSDQSSQQQQQQRQSSAAQIVADVQQQITESQQLSAAAKVTAEAAPVRSDALFSSSLHSAQAHQQTGAVRSAQASPAELLKQSLNLLQHDGASQLRERVNLMVRQNIQVAEIRLDPAGLGQMQIKIDMQQDQASVQFMVQQPQAKEALEQQMPRLREMLQQQGIVLSEGNVQQHSQQQERQMAQRDGHSGNRNSQQDGADDGLEAASVVQVTATVSEQLVDYYA